jgi:KUP system potassium uptake protein
LHAQSRTLRNRSRSTGISVHDHRNTHLTFFVIRYGWGYPLPVCIAATGMFFVVDVSFFASNLLQIADDDWFPLLMAGALFVILATWKDGRRILSVKLRERALELLPFLDNLIAYPPNRVEGTAVFFSAEAGVVPNALLHNLKHNKVMHRNNPFVTVCSQEIPLVPLEQRGEVTSLGSQCWAVTLNFGFMDAPDVPKALARIATPEWLLEPMTTSYFLSRDIVIPTLGTGMALWREKLFAQMHRNASASAEYLYLPSNSVVELGAKIEIRFASNQAAGLDLSCSAECSSSFSSRTFSPSKPAMAAIPFLKSPALGSSLSTASSATTAPMISFNKPMVNSFVNRQC